MADAICSVVMKVLFYAEIFVFGLYMFARLHFIGDRDTYIDVAFRIQDRMREDIWGDSGIRIFRCAWYGGSKYRYSIIESSIQSICGGSIEHVT